LAKPRIYLIDYTKNIFLPRTLANIRSICYSIFRLKKPRHIAVRPSVTIPYLFSMCLSIAAVSSSWSTTCDGVQHNGLLPTVPRSIDHRVSFKSLARAPLPSTSERHESPFILLRPYSTAWVFHAVNKSIRVYLTVTIFIV
jgi:hypothetical protein